MKNIPQVYSNAEPNYASVLLVVFCIIIFTYYPYTKKCFPFNML